MMINPDAFATGFEECKSPFSQELMAFRLVVMEVLVYDMCGQ